MSHFALVHLTWTQSISCMLHLSLTRGCMKHNEILREKRDRVLILRSKPHPLIPQVLTSLHPIESLFLLAGVAAPPYRNLRSTRSATDGGEWFFFSLFPTRLTFLIPPLRVFCFPIRNAKTVRKSIAVNNINGYIISRDDKIMNILLLECFFSLKQKRFYTAK